MDEKTQEKLKEAEPETPTADTDKGVQSETESQFDRAGKVVKDLKEQLDRKEKLVEREEKLAVQKQLEGRGEAGASLPPVDRKAEEAEARQKAIGKSTGALWAKDKE